MANVQRNFIKGVMNKSLDERLLPNGQYVDALNVRLGSTEDSEIGSVENSKGNSKLTSLEYNGNVVGQTGQAKCIGAYEDGANETLYWFVHDPDFQSSPTNKIDLIVSLNVQTNVLTYHVISVDDGGGINTTLNFNDTYLITGVNLVDNTLLFFTDDLNPPRVINVTKNYPNPVALVDGFTPNSILVIKKPPLNSPNVVAQPTSSQNNFLEDRFVCFAYRYKYADGEYSATSQFSNPAFLPGAFDYSFATGLNEGMLNLANQATIEYNSGDDLVVGIDLLWKDNATGLIRVIEKLDKSVLGLINNTNYTYTFSNSKVFTVLPDSEILRLYDNVPRLAQAQTIMGNRLMYGDYLEQYNLVSKSGFPLNLDYTVEKISNDVGLSELEDELTTGNYLINGNQTADNAIITFKDIGLLDLKAGAAIDFTIVFEHFAFTGQAPFPQQTTGQSEINFQYVLPQDFASAFELANSVDFIEKIGTITNIEPVATACDGSTFTDLFNCIIPQTLDTLEKYESGIDAVGEPIRIISSPGSDDIGFQLPAMSFVDDPTGAAITQTVYEYYSIISSQGTFQELGDPKSLHSNRSYEIGIIYMDEFNRATTALVSDTNTIHVPCSDSELANSIRVTIPPTQQAPEWARRYKFCIKANKENYFNVYSSFFFRDPTTSADYFLLEGQNSRKVEEGDILTVKADTNGPLRRCANATVLEKKSQPADFLGNEDDGAPPLDPSGAIIPIPAGVYMKLRANEFSTTVPELPTVNFGEKSSKGSGCRIVHYPVQIEDPSAPGTYIDYTIPAGSRIRIVIDNYRRGNTDKLFGGVSKKIWFVDADFTASQDYPNFVDWFNGDNVALALQQQGSDEGTGVSGPNYNPVLDGGLLSCETGRISCVFETPAASGQPQNTFTVKSSKGYSGSNKNARLKVRIEVLRSTSFIAFETEPQDAQPDVWFESSKSYEIAQANSCSFDLSVDTDEPNPIQFDYVDTNGLSQSVIVPSGGNANNILGECNSMVISPSTPPVDPANITIDSILIPIGCHLGNVQNQTTTDPAIIDTAFFNCYSFGNGVESYVIRDAIAKNEVALGNRVTSTSAQDYQEIRRFSDITYSGVFNDESNVNKLNEFNLGLLNFKSLEETYGPIYLIDGRETDILVLQEDKISYVLTGKNLLSDSTGGGSVSSVPEVLGTQIARIEEYGISFHPESYAKWGANKFFTDAKRGAVIQLKGSSAQNEQLTVISEAGMRSWFRDLFSSSFNTQKLGGFDPYMNEYVLSSNTEFVPEIVECIDCGISRTVIVTSTQDVNFCVNVGALVGDSIVTYNVIGANQDTFDISATYDGTTVTSGPTGVSGSLTVVKDDIAVDEVEIQVTSTGSTQLEITVECPFAQEITIIQVCYSLDADAGEFIHNEYRWADGAFNSPLQSEQVELVSGISNPLISQYSQVTGPQGGGFIPADGATISIISNRIPPIDDYVFDPAVDELRYLRTNTFFANTPNDMAALLAASNNATPITGGPNQFEAQFTMPSTNDEYLYLIYNYRRATEVQLCAGTSIFSVCCECTEENLIVRQCRQDFPAVSNQYVIPQTAGLVPGVFVTIDQADSDCVFEVITTTIESVNAAVTAVRNDITDCDEVCQQYIITNNSTTSTLGATYVDCDDDDVSFALQPLQSETVCAKVFNITPGPGIDYSISLQNCECQTPEPPNNFDVRQCRLDGVVVNEVVSGIPGVQTGSFVTLTSPADCVYEVFGTTGQQPSASINQLLNITSCTDVCQQYSVFNNSPDQSHVLDFINCDDEGDQVTIGIGQTVVLCMKDIIGTPSTELQITLDNCLCNQNFYDAQLCEISAVTDVPLNVDPLVVVADPTNQLAIGYHVFINGCAYEIQATSSGPATATYSSFSASFNCNDACNTYEIDNVTAFTWTLNYKDCNGVSQTENISPGTTIDRCISEWTGGQPAGVVIRHKSCGCNLDQNLVLRKCRQDGVITEVIAPNDTGAIVVGDFVIIASDPDCPYEVVNVTFDSPNATIQGSLSITDCSDVCQTYELENTTNSVRAVEYKDCNGVTQGASIDPFGTLTICLTEMVTDPNIDWLDINLVSCTCLNIRVQQCRLDGVVEQEVLTNTLNASVGDFISIDADPNCAWEVIELTTDGVTGPDAVALLNINDCTEVCQTYTLTNVGTGIISVNYLDCDDNSQTIGVEVGIPQTICAKDITNVPDITVALTDCTCTIVPNEKWLIQLCLDSVLFPSGGITAVIEAPSGLLSVGDFVSIQNFNPQPPQPNNADCAWQVIGSSESNPTETFKNKLSITDCTDNCVTYVVTLAQGAQPVTIEYIDCDGNTQTNTLVSGQPQNNYMCLKSVVSISGDTNNIDASLYNCGCLSKKQLRLCEGGTTSNPVPTQNLVVDDPTFAIDIGDIVIANDGTYECSYTAIDYAPELTPVTGTVSSVDKTGDCADYCRVYRVFEQSGGTQSVTFRDCSNSALIITFNYTNTGSNPLFICAREIINYSGSPSIRVEECDCDNTWLLRICRPPNTGNATGSPDTIYGEGATNNLNITTGDVVNVGGCAYNVIAQMKDQNTTPVTIDSIAAVSDCDGVCVEMEITNISGSTTSSQNYVDCNGVTQNTGSIAPGDSLTVCMAGGQGGFVPSLNTSVFSADVVGCSCSIVPTYRAEIVNTATFYGGGIAPNNYTLNPVVDSYYVYDTQNQLAINDFIDIGGLMYEITQTEPPMSNPPLPLQFPPPAGTFTKLTGVSASDACAQYLVKWLTSGTFSYVDCNGNNGGMSRAAGTEAIICMRTVNPSTSASFTIDLYGRGDCNTGITEIRQASLCNLGNQTPDPTAFPSSIFNIRFDNSLGKYQTGDQVWVGDYKYNVGGTTVTNPTDLSYVTDFQPNNCESGCATYSVRMTSGSDLLSYIGCNGDTEAITVTTTPQTICAQSFNSAFPPLMQVTMTQPCCGYGYDTGTNTAAVCKEIMVTRIQNTYPYGAVYARDCNLGNLVTLPISAQGFYDRSKGCISQITGINGSVRIQTINCNCKGFSKADGNACQYKLEVTRINAGTSLAPGLSTTEIMDSQCQTGQPDAGWNEWRVAEFIQYRDVVWSGEEAFEVTGFVDASTPTTKDLTFWNKEITVNDVCNTYTISNSTGSPQSFSYIDCGTNTEVTDTIGPIGTFKVCAKQFTSLPNGVGAELSDECCSAFFGTVDLCKMYRLRNQTSSPITVEWKDCDGNNQTYTFGQFGQVTVCAKEIVALNGATQQIQSCNGCDDTLQVQEYYGSCNNCRQPNSQPPV